MPITAEELLDNITRYGIEFYRLYPGLYRGVVSANDDPEGRGRVRVQVAAFQDRPSPTWVKAAMQGAGDGRGIFWPPEVGDPVFVSFAQGQPDRPECYFGGWWGKRDGSSDVPDDLGYSGDGYPVKRGFVTRWGHKLIFNEEDGSESVELVWNKPNPSDEARTDRAKTASPGSATEGGGAASLKFTSDGSIEITDNATPTVQTVKMDATAGTIEIADKNGNKVVLGPSGARVEATAIDLGGSETSPFTEPAVLGTKWLTWAATHTHGHPMGPTVAPITPPTPDILSTTVRLK